MRKLSLVLSVLLMSIALMNCASNPQTVYSRENYTITKQDVIPANKINIRYLKSNNLEQVKYVMMHIVKYKMKFPEVDYCCVKNALEKLGEEGETHQIRVMAHLTRGCLNESVKITNIEKLVKMSDADQFYATIYDEINKSDSKYFVYEESTIKE